MPSKNTENSDNKSVKSILGIDANQVVEKLLAKERSLHELLINTSRGFISVPIQGIDEMINKTLADLGNYIGADRFYVFDYDFKNNLTSNTYEWCANDILPQIDTLKDLPLDLFSEWTAIHLQGKSIIIDDVLSLEPLSPIRDLLLPQGIKSLIAVPLINGKNCIGFVGFDAVNNHHKFTSLEQTLLNVFASSFVGLINRKTSEAALLKSKDELDERNKELECIYKITELGEIESISFNSYFEELSQIIAQAFQFPQNTSVQITINQKEFKSNPYLETNSVISIALNFQNLNEPGQLTVYNPKNEPFLKEECQLIETIKRIVEQTFEKKESQKRLIASEEKYKQLFMDSPEAFLLIDNAIIIDCNNAASKLIELNREDIIGKSPVDLSPKVQPNYRDSEAYAIEIIKSAYAEGYKSFEWVHTKGNGKPFLAQVRLSITNVNGKDLLFTSWRDITKQKETEEEMRKFRIISDQANYGSALTTLEGQITYCNEAFAHMHGYQVDELMGKQIAFLHNSEQLKVVVPLLEDIKTKGGFDHTEVGRLKKDGSTFPTLMTAKLMLDNQNTPLFLSATLIDISERKKIEQEIIDLNQNLETKIQIRTKEIENTNKQLIEARIEAEKANRFKSDFLSRISHELRAPLNSILGFTQLLEMGELNAGQQKGINHILNSGKHLLELINEVLDISKIEAGKIRMSFEAVDLQNTILEVTETLFPLAKSKNVRLHIDAISTPCLVKADVQRLKQILINLTNNAIKYNKENGEVWLSFNKVMEDISPNGIIRISIKDNGTGIDQADLQRIFKPFERADQLNLNMEGTGLGLSVVKQLIDLMEGFIGVESEVGVGSTFWIELPLYFSGLMQQTISQEIEKPAVPSPKDHQPLL